MCTIYFSELDVNYVAPGDPREFLTDLCRTKLPALQHIIAVGICREGKLKLQITRNQYYFFSTIYSCISLKETHLRINQSYNQILLTFLVQCVTCKTVTQNDVQPELFLSVPANIASVQDGLN